MQGEGEWGGRREGGRQGGEESAGAGLVGADVDAAGADHAALVGHAQPGRVAGVQGGAAAQRGGRLGRGAVVLEGAEQRVDGGGGAADEVAVDPVAQAAHAAAVADQVVVAAGVQGAVHVIAGRAGGAVEVAGDQRVVQHRRAELNEQAAAVRAAAPGVGPVGSEGDIRQGDGEWAIVVDAAAVVGRGVAGQGAVADRQRAAFIQAPSLTDAAVPAETAGASSSLVGGNGARRTRERAAFHSQASSLRRSATPTIIIIGGTG